MTAPQPRGPAAHHPSANDPSNPYDFPPQLWHAGKLPPKVTDKYVFFFGYEGPEPEVALQQWFPAPFRAARYHPGADRRPLPKTEVEFPTAEHYMMYHKALIMGDEDVAEQIITYPQNSHPSTSKRLGRTVTNFSAELWRRHADTVVEEANYLKFSTHADLRWVLLGTGTKTLVEASPDDRIWGIGFNSEGAEDKKEEWGGNGLGRALVRVRERIRREIGG